MDPDELPPVTLPRPRPPAAPIPTGQPLVPAAPPKDGCAWCGDPRHGHGRQWHPVRGWHDWEAEPYAKEPAAVPRPGLPKRPARPTPEPQTQPDAIDCPQPATASGWREPYDELADLRRASTAHRNSPHGHTALRALLLRIRRFSRIQ